MTLWVRYAEGAGIGFGTLEDGTINAYTGDMFAAPTPTGHTLSLDAVRLLAPTVPAKMVALWNNFRAMGTKLGLATPDEPLYFIKAASSYADPNSVIHRPTGYSGKVVFEGELAIVIGARCTRVDPAQAARSIFGYTCVNDITASDILNKDPSFAQWTRAKSFDGFSPLGPAIATGLQPETLVVRTVLNGTERQNYPVADMVFPPAKLVSLLSHDMTLMPGDVICCGTSLGVGVMKEPTNTVDVIIDGIGVLQNRYENSERVPEASNQHQANTINRV